jgi:hypothetical protein
MITLYPNWYRSVMTKRAVMVAAGLAMVALALAGCGDSVHAGGENAAIHPSSAIWVSPTDGAANISGHKGPPIPPAEPLPAKTPTAVPAGQISTVTNIQTVVNGGCWKNAGLGNVYGAYDQHFWWMGACADTTAQVAVELYPTAATATAKAHHPSPTSLLERYQDGNVLVDVYSNAPGNVLTQLATVKGLVPVPGYGE